MAQYDLIGTRNLVMNVIGNFRSYQTRVNVNPQHSLPEEIENSVLAGWLKSLEGKKNALIADKKYAESDVRIDMDYKPMPRLLVREGGQEKPIMFAGPLMRIDNYRIEPIFEGTDSINSDITVPVWGDSFVIEGSPTNYAAMMSTQNTRPYEILDKYGMNGLPNSSALSTTPTFKSKDGEVIQKFKRVSKVGEYPDYEGTAAGNVSDIVPNAVVLTSMKELYEESGLVPYVSSIDDLKEMGIVRKDATIEEKTYYGGLKGILVKRGNTERKAVFYESEPIVRGMVMNIDIDDIGKDGKVKPHFKHEFMVTLETGLDVDAYNANGLWEKEDEHASVGYIGADMERVREYILSTQSLPNRAMPVTHGVMMYHAASKNGVKALQDLVNEINQKFPIPEDHPFYSRLKSTKLEESGYNTKTLIQDSLVKE